MRGIRHRPKVKTAAKRKGGRSGAAVALPPEYNMLLTATLCLLALGAVMVFSASSTTQVLSDGGLSNSIYYLQRTVIFAGVGLIVMYFMSRRGLALVRQATPLILALTFVALVAVLAVGNEVNGAKSWMGAGMLRFQPSEFAKIALILYGAAVLAEKPKMTRSVGDMMPYLLVVGAVCGLVMLQPDLGTIMVTVFAAGAILIAAGARVRDLALILAAVGSLAMLMAIIEPYRRDRLIGFLNPGADTAGTGFQAMQAKIAMGSGGLTGVGIGDGVQKAFYLPEAHTDMIVAVIGEEIGLLGVFIVVALFVMLGYCGFKIAHAAPDRYTKLLAAGLTSLIMSQAIINLFAVMGLAPLTGVPLPFVSYGNNSVIVCLMAVGLLLNISRGSSRAATGRVGRGTAKLRVINGGRDAKPAVKSGRSGSARAPKQAAKPAPGRATSSGGGSRRDGRTRRSGPGGGRRASSPRR
jgi:cell division protein FtsW